MSDSTRLDSIEIKLAYLEQVVAELNEVIIRQQRDLERLSASERVLAQQLQELESGGGANPGGYEKPPHY